MDNRGIFASPPLILGIRWLKLLLAQTDFVRYSFRLPLTQATLIGKYRRIEIIICP